MDQNTGEPTYTPDFLSDTEGLHATLLNAGIGIWEVRLDTNIVSWDNQCKRLFGLEKANRIPYNEAVKHIHSGDVGRVNTAVQNALAGQDEGRYDVIYRTIGGDDKKLRWVRFTGQAFFDENNIPFRFAGIGQDITSLKQAETAKDEFEKSDKRFRELANSLQALVWTADKNGLQTFASDRWKEFTGLDPSDENTFQQMVHHDDLLTITTIWGDCLRSGDSYRTEVRLRRHDGIFQWFDVQGDPLRNENGEIEKWIGTFLNVDQKKQTEQQLFETFKALEENEATFNDVTNSSPTGLWLSNKLGELTYVNKTLVEWTGFSYEHLLGSGWANAIIEEDRSNSAQIFLTAVEALAHYDTTFRIKKANSEIVWCRAAGDPFYRDGIYVGYAGFCMDINEMVNFTNEIQAGEERFRAIVDQAPMAIGLLKGRDMIIEVGNEKIFEVWGKDNTITGKRIIEALPEIKGQGYLELLEGVFDTGSPFFGNGFLANLERKGRLEQVYFDFAYTPLRDAKSKIIGVMVLASEVTEQILAKKSVEEAEALLRGSIELAELATWSLDLDKMTFSCSDRFSLWLGKSSEIILLNQLLQQFEGESKVRFESLVAVMKSGRMTSSFHDEFDITDPKSGHERVIHIHGQVVVRGTKNISIRGTAQDVTNQKALQKELQRLVQLRTEELATSNQELASSNEELQSANEELMATNEELSQSTHSLERSNEELAQYAYVASHDLQEPLRKIRTFSDRLRREVVLPVQQRDWVDKIDNSSLRMSLLIKNLLEFSRLIRPEESFEHVSLKDVVEDICKDYDLIIEERSITLDTSDLPTVTASVLQMHQLFQNLIGNAIKFMAPDRSPRIAIRSERLNQTDMQKYVSSPCPFEHYFHITVTDNGIGFKQEYADRIFEIFKRLHGKAEYNGSGIGLALCKRIVTNHSGYIYAESEPGTGSIFHVFLPNEISVVDRKLGV